MKTTLLTALAAAALLAACDRTPHSPGSPPQPKMSSPAGTGASTPTTPANVGTPSAAEKREGANPTQGQVDPKEPAQHKDFQHRGDGAGPKPGG